MREKYYILYRREIKLRMKQKLNYKESLKAKFHPSAAIWWIFFLKAINKIISLIVTSSSTYVPQTL
jgi:hypothetical protein